MARSQKVFIRKVTKALPWSVMVEGELLNVEVCSVHKRALSHTTAVVRVSLPAANPPETVAILASMKKKLGRALLIDDNYHALSIEAFYRVKDLNDLWFVLKVGKRPSRWAKVVNLDW